MAFTVNLYSFSKRENSTARPSGAARSFSCVVKTSTGILRPTIELDLGLSESPAQYNYAYIPQFNRYYFIEEWSFGTRLWEAQLSVDVLATYKNEIGASNLYVLRAAAEYDGRVIDNLYPTKVNAVYDSSIITNPYESIINGCYVIGVVSKTPVYGSINYYVVNRTAMQEIVQSLLDDTINDPDNHFSLNDASEGLQLALIDPLQYIKSAVFLPIPYSGIPGGAVPLGYVFVFNYKINTSGSVKIVLDTPYIKKTYNFEVKKHPQTAARGNYVNVAPYTNATLIFPPFGAIEIDSTVICDVNSITAELTIDTTSGLGILEIKANNIVLNRLEAQIGVPIQLSQVTRDYMGAFNQTMGAVSNIAGAIGSGIAGNKGDAVSKGIGAAQGIGNAAASLVPRSQTIGSGGSYAQLYTDPRLDFQFFECVDDDIAQNGRPLCKMKQINTLSGYMLIQDGDVPTTGTAEENRSIRAYLEGGFYYE